MAPEKRGELRFVEEYGLEALVLGIKSRETAWKLRRGNSRIPKPPQGDQLFKYNGLDRLYSNIPYPPPSTGSIKPTLASFYQGQSRGDDCWTEIERVSSMVVEWEGSVSEESLSDSVQSMDYHLSAFAELKDDAKAPTLKPLQPTFLKDCLVSLQIDDNSVKSKTRSSDFVDFSLEYESIGKREVECEVMGHYKSNKERDSSKYLFQVTSAMEPSSRSPSKKLVQQYCDPHENQEYIISFNNNVESWTTAANPIMHQFPSSLFSWNDKESSNNNKEEVLLNPNQVSKGVVKEDHSHCKIKPSRGIGGWMHSAFNGSLKMLAVVAGVAILAQNAPPFRNTGEFTSNHNAKNLDFPNQTIASFYNSGAYPLSLLDLESFHTVNN
eukprot:g6353.t1